MKWLLIVLSAVAIQGCSNLPVAIKNPPDPDLQYQEVAGNVSQFQGKAVRWGGTIIHVENEEKSSMIQILNYPLNSQGRPELDQRATGRFLLFTTKFLDPAIYAKNDELTVAGTVDGESTRKVGHKELTLPVVKSETLFLWPKRSNRYCNYGFNPYYYYGLYPYGFYGYYGYPSFYYPCY